ncbi:MAG: amidase [Planctomycetaceae bacterium]|nr:amidase [Planctomycetaceae bacterium]
MHEVLNRSAVQLRAMIENRDISARELLALHLAQIEKINPSVNAIVTLVKEQAEASAQALDDSQARGEATGVLHGLPIAHKDLVMTKGIRTTYGSPIYADNIPQRDELLIERLNAAGVVTLGKTNTPEFGAGSQTFNNVFGATCNPYDLSRTCGGSSGGAAVALATRMLPIADGSDMGGSLRNPANFCNVVGFRPSTGRVPSWPSDNAWFSFGVQGPMARYVEDIALQLQVMAGPDDRAPLSLQQPGSVFARSLDVDMTGKRVAFAPTLGGLPVEQQVRDVIEKQRVVFEELGCIVEDACLDFDGADEVFKVLRAFRFEMKFGALVAEHESLIKETVLWNVEQGRRLTGPEIGKAQQRRTILFQKTRQFFEKFDYLIAPVSQVAPFAITQPFVEKINDVEMETYVDWMKSCYFVTATGMPAISVPAGFTLEGLPVGLQIVAGFRRDLEVLQLARAFEQCTLVANQLPELLK